VVDTMVVAFALIGEADLHQRAIRLLRATEELWAPESLRAELVNVLRRLDEHRREDGREAVAVVVALHQRPGGAEDRQFEGPREQA
jgi:hypothetical protein